MICTNKNTFSFVSLSDQPAYYFYILEYLIGPTNKRYNYFSIISSTNVDYVLYNDVIYNPNYEVKIKIENVNEEILVKKIKAKETINEKVVLIEAAITIFFGYSEEVEFSP